MKANRILKNGCSVTVTAVMFAALFRAAALGAAEKFYTGTGGDLKASTPGNWLDGTVPVDGDTVVLDANAANSDLTWDIDVTLAGWRQSDYTGTVTFYTGKASYSSARGVLSADGERKELVVSGDIVLSSGKWTHAANPKNAPTDGFGYYRLFVVCSGSMTLGADASIDTTGRGYASGKGVYTERVSFSDTQLTCPSHGGFGSMPSNSDPSVFPCYGDIYEPQTLGSAGKDYWSGPAGGVVHLSVAGHMTLDGPIKANGTNWGSVGRGCSTGGSIFIKASSISGSGAVTADGAYYTSNIYKGGGGGRVAIKLTGEGADFSAFNTDNVRARGGIGMISGAEKIYDSLDGGPGTVYFETKADGEKGGVLVIKGSGSVSTDMRGAGLCSNMCESFSFSHVILTNGGRLAVCKGVDLKVLSYSDADKTAKFNGLSVFGGTLELPAAVTNLKIVSCGEGSVIRPLSGDTLELCSNSLLKANSSLAVESNLTVGANAKITHTSSRKMALHVHGNLEIEEKGVITATGLGYVAKKGPGSVSIDPSSASHGGIGYAEGASCYGDIKTPVEYGSGAYNYHAGAGGGVIRLVVGNTTALDGSIVADAAANKEGQSGSSGGSIWLDTGRLTGSGLISANGSDGPYRNYDGGGGGRVAVYLTQEGSSFDDFGGRITAYGGDGVYAGDFPGGAGSVYLKTAAQAHGTLVIDNGSNAVKACTTDISASITSVEFDDVVIRAGGMLRVRDGSELVIHGNLTTDASSVITNEPLGLVRFVDASSVSTLSGTNRFTCFSCETPGKEIRFSGEASFFEIMPAGSLVLKGAQDGALTLAPTGATPWYMKLGTGVMQDISFVDVRMSDARGGIAVSAIDSVDGGENENWYFATVEAGAVNEWTGAVDGDWSNAGNWSLSRPPVDTDSVVVPAGTPAVTAVNDMTVSNLTVSGTLALAGTLSLTVTGDIDFSAGTFDAGESTVTIAGGGDCNVNADGEAFHVLVMKKSGGSVTFTGPLEARRFEDYATAAHSLLFAPGKRLKAGTFVLDGRVGGDVPAISVSSTVPGSRWELEVLEISSVLSVDVGDCDASSGQKLTTYAPSVNAGGNVNWAFMGGIAFWSGAKDTVFDDPENWSGGVVPSADDHVMIESGSAVITGTTSFAGLVLGVPAGDQTVSFRVNAETRISGNMVVYGGATLVLDKPVAVSGSGLVSSGALLTHTAGAGKIDMSFGENFEIEEGARIDVAQKGYAAGSGPGYVVDYGSAYGGSPEEAASSAEFKCYGSLYYPDDWGSGNCNRRGDYKPRGGGAVKITAGGMFIHNGEICAAVTDKRGYTGAASGGSVLIVAAAVTGSGSINAYGGVATYIRSGGGGRVAIHQTLATEFLFDGTITANGGRATASDTSLPRASAGSVYIRNAGDGEFGGTCVFDNRNTSKAAAGYGAVVPATLDGDDHRVMRDTAFVIERGGSMALSRDLTVRELEMNSSVGKLDLNGFRLRILSTKHKGRRGWLGTVIEDGGSIVWGAAGFGIIVR